VLRHTVWLVGDTGKAVSLIIAERYCNTVYLCTYDTGRPGGVAAYRMIHSIQYHTSLDRNHMQPPTAQRMSSTCCAGGCPGSGLDALIPFLTAVSTAIVPLAALLLLLPRGRFVELRLCVFVAAFILLRDTMTPAGLWQLLPVSPDVVGFRLRLPSSPALLVFLGVASAALVPIMTALEPSFSRLVFSRSAFLGRWGSPARSVAAGMLAAAGIALPSAVVRGLLPQSVVSVWHCLDLYGLPALGAFALLGNYYEEALFRGCLYGHLVSAGAGFASEGLAAQLSAVAFCCGHVFLATTVTQVGWPLLAFTLYEGAITAALRPHGGLLAATVAHGCGIFLVAVAGAGDIRV
jgi:uncharacterized protein